MKNNILGHLDLLIERYPILIECKKNVWIAYKILEACYQSYYNKLLVCGNGGSAADAEHIVGELMKGFKNPRKIAEFHSSQLKKIDLKMGLTLSEQLQGALPAIALDGHIALSTAYMNDCIPQLCFAQQVYGYGLKNDVLLAISTSGNSQNVLYAAITAKAKHMKVIGLTGATESKLSAIADVCIKAPSTETYIVQEYHLPIYHTLCLMLEDRFFAEKSD